jgi:phosphoribosylglycinamide formyltransferase-1
MATRGPLRLGILASGTGTNFEAIADAVAAGRVDATIGVVVCNREGAAVIEKARSRGIETVVVPHRDHPDRHAFESAVVTALSVHAVELVVMAGFDRLVTTTLLGSFPQRVINIHPALLPAFKGLDAQSQALEYGARIAGATVHVVDERMDHGPIIVQVAVPISGDDDAETVRQRVLAQEHIIYPFAIQLFAEGRIEIDGRRVRIRGEAAPSPDAYLISPLPRR